MTEYKNPKPIAVAIIVGYDSETNESGLLVIRRSGVKHFNGVLAFPSGYMNLGETWQQSTVRELKEETGIDADPREVHLLHVATSPLNGNLQVFGVIRHRAVNVRELKPTNEASEFLLVGREGFETEFSTHLEALRVYYRIDSDSTRNRL